MIHSYVTLDNQAAQAPGFQVPFWEGDVLPVILNHQGD
jgi:hypothetical protein